MTDRDALLAAVRHRPDDDTPRLVYADWLDDQGEPTMSHHAAFIRGQVEAARAGSRCVSSRWSGKGTRLSSMCNEWMVWDEDAPPPSPLFLHNAGNTGVVWHRGFLEAVSAGPNDWLRIGHEVLRQHPALGLVCLQTRPADLFTINRRPERFVRGEGGHVARRLGWTVRVPFGTGALARSGDWVEIARFDLRVFFEAVFPDTTIAVWQESSLYEYPHVKRPERVAVRAEVTPPTGAARP